MSPICGIFFWLVKKYFFESLSNFSRKAKGDDPGKASKIKNSLSLRKNKRKFLRKAKGNDPGKARGSASKIENSLCSRTNMNEFLRKAIGNGVGQQLDWTGTEQTPPNDIRGWGWGWLVQKGTFWTPWG